MHRGRKMDKILLAHGSGGKLTHELIKDLFLDRFNNPILKYLDDSAVFKFEGKKLAFTTDSYVVTPIFFKGGDIGKLAICGTVNDLAMAGAIPYYLVAGFIIEEGFPIKDLEHIVNSMKKTSEVCGVKIIAGDTKVVGKGAADKIFINTAGIGIIEEEVNISSSNAQPEDVIILSGTIGEHGIAILSAREGLNFTKDITSDCAPLNRLVEDMIKVSKKIHVLRDLTRGGLATALNEIAYQSGVGIIIDEEKIIIKEEVKGACELLGLDPLYIACEGRLIAFVPKHDAQQVLLAMHKNEYGNEATIIGKVVSEPKEKILLLTKIGGKRIIDMPLGEQLPRIC
jgi:hydrogenase expression/formation protein HypE